MTQQLSHLDKEKCGFCYSLKCVKFKAYNHAKLTLLAQIDRATKPTQLMVKMIESRPFFGCGLSK